ncbi:MAG: hypothetical protein KC731_16925 [Myxococcales bacterium]|nr:hypothetical protein [Myxococcales bacterium]
MRAVLRAAAMLDAILAPSWERRVHSFAASIGPEGAVGSLRDGEGDWLVVLFPPEGGAAIRGFAHESVMAPAVDGDPRPGLFAGLPERYAWVRDATGWPEEEVTFCIWHDAGWRIGEVRFPEGEADPDGSEQLLASLPWDADRYVAFARDYFERELDGEAVAAIYAGAPLTDALIVALAPEAKIRFVRREAVEIGYPMASTKKKTKKTATKKTAKAAGEAKPKEKKAPKPGSAAAKRLEAVARMKALKGFGEASFRVELKGHSLRMMVHDEAVVEVTLTEGGLYEELFDLVKRTISNAKN